MPQRSHAPRFALRELGDAISGERDTVGRQRAARALWLAARAHTGAQIHDRLGVIGQPRLGQQRFGQCPQRAQRLRIGRRAADRLMARQHAADVAIEDRQPLAMGLREDGRRRGAADARQRGQRIDLGRQLAAVRGLAHLRCPMQIAGTRVVAEARPQRQHLVLRRLGECGQAREARQEALVVRNDRAHLGLLQHHLSDPHPVWRARVLPGQIMATVLVVPAQQTRREGRRRRSGHRLRPQD